MEAEDDEGEGEARMGTASSRSQDPGIGISMATRRFTRAIDNSPALATLARESPSLVQVSVCECGELQSLRGGGMGSGSG